MTILNGETGLSVRTKLLTGAFPISDDVAALLASAEASRGEGALWRTWMFDYTEAAVGADDYHLINAVGVKLYAIADNNDAFTVQQFGGVDNTDISDAFQAAINAALYNADRAGEYMHRVSLDVHKGTLSRSMYVCYGGASYKRIGIYGFGRPNSATTTASTGTDLTFTSVEGAAFIIEGGRRPVLSGFRCQGQLYDTIKAITQLGATPNEHSLKFQIPENFDPKTWDKLIVTGGVVPNRRYAPYAGVAIDPRGANRPPNKIIASMTIASPAVIMTTTDHGFNTLAPETIEVSGLAAQGIPDGEYYAVYVSPTTAQLWNLDWTSTTSTGTSGGLIVFPYYDAPTYPPQEGPLNPDTAKKHTSEWIFEDASFEGFEVGVVVNPSQDGSNGDFGEFRPVNVEYAKYAYSVSQPNARINRFLRCNVFGLYSVFDNYHYGVATGNLNCRVEGMGGGYFIKWFDLSSSSRFGDLLFDACHPEGVGMLGSFNGGGSAAGSITFNASTLKFNHDHISPPSLLSNPSDDPAPVNLFGGSIETNRGFSMQTRHLKTIGTFMFTLDDPVKTYRKQAHNNSLLCASNPRVDFGSPVQRRWNLTTGVIGETSQLGPGLGLTGRDFCIPIHTRTVSRDGRNEAPNSVLNYPSFDFTIAVGQRTFGGSPVADRSITFTFSAYVGFRMVQNGIRNGNVLVDFVNGTVMIIRSVDYVTGVVICTLETNWYDNGVDPAGLFDPTWDYVNNLWTLFRTDIYSPPSQIYGDFTSGSPIITNIVTVGGNSSDETNFGLAVGDLLAARYYPNNLFGNVDTTINAIDIVANTATLNSNAGATRANVPIDYVMRVSPANEATV